MPNDAEFVYTTNIAKVASEIAEGFNRIRRETERGIQQAGAGTGGSSLAQQLFAGVEQKIGLIGTQLAQQLAKAAQVFNAEVGKGGTFAGASLGKGAPTQNFGVQVQRLVRESMAQVESLAKAAGQALPEGMEGVRPQLEQVIRAGAEQMLAEVERFYAVMRGDMRRLAGEAGTVGLSTPTEALRGSAGTVIRGRAAAITAPGAEGPLDPVALRRALGEVFSGLESIDPNAIATAFNEANQKVRAWQSEAVRIAKEVQANLTMPGGVEASFGALRNPAGARDFGNLVRDEMGQWFEKVRGAEGEFLGVRPYQGAGDPIARAQEAVIGPGGQDARARAEELKRQVDEEMLQRDRAAQLDLETEQRRAKAVTDEIAMRLQAGTATEAGKFARTSEGAVFARGSQVNPDSGVREPIWRRVNPQTESELLRQSTVAFDRQAKQQARQEAAGRAKLNKALQRDLDARLGGGFLGGPNAGDSRPLTLAGLRAGGLPQQPKQGGLEMVMQRAFGGQGGRGLRLSDMLSTGFTFARYMAAAAVFGVVFKAVETAKKAILDYEDSLTDLNVALGESGKAQGSFTRSMGEFSRLAGENPGDALDAATRGIRSFTSAYDDLATKQNAGAAVTKAVTQLSVIGEKGLKDATGDIIAIGKSFDVPVDNLQRVVDAVASAKRNLGGDAKSVSQALAGIAPTAQQAGFTLEATANLVSLIIARTDQGAGAVSDQLSRVFAQLGGAGQGKIAQLNEGLSSEKQIDLNARLSDQLMQIAHIYPELTQQQRGYITSALGGTRNVRALLPILTSEKELLRALDDSYNTAGEGTDEFNRKSRDLTGVMKKIRGDIESVVVELRDAGIFDIFLVGLRAVEPFLFAIRELLTVYNALPGPMRHITALTLEWLAAQKALTALAAVRTGFSVAEVRGLPFRDRMRGIVHGNFSSAMGNGEALFNRQFTLRDIGQNIARRAPVPEWFTRDRAMAELRSIGNAGEVGATFTAGAEAGRIAKLGEAIKGLSVASAASGALNLLKASIGRLMEFLGKHPILTALAGVYAIKSTFDATVDIIRTVNAGTAALSDASGAHGVTRDVATQLQTRATAMREASSGFWGFLSNLAQGRPVERTAGTLEHQAKLIMAAQKKIDEVRSEVARSGDPVDVLDVTSGESIKQGLDLLQNSGRNATSQLHALIGAMDRLASSAERGQNNLNDMQIVEFTNRLGASIAASFQETASIGVDTDPHNHYRKQAVRNAANIPDDLVQRANDMAKEFLDSTGGQLNPDQSKQLSDMLWRTLFKPWVDKYPALRDEAEAQLKGDVLVAVRNMQRGVTQVEDLQADINAIMQYGPKIAQAHADLVKNNAALAGDRPADLTGARELVRQLQLLRMKAVAADANSRQLEQIDDLITKARIDEVQAVQKHIDAMEQLAESLLSPTNEVGKLDSQIGAVDDKLKLQLEADERAGLESKRNDLANQRAKAVMERDSARTIAIVDSRDEVGRAQAEATKAYNELALIEQSGDTTSKAYWEALDTYHKALQARARAEVERLNATQRMNIDPRDELRNAAQDVADQVHVIGTMLPGSTEWALAQRKLSELERSYVEAQINVWSEARLTQADPESQLEKARATLTNARQELRNALPGQADYWQKLRAVHEAEVAYSDAVLESAHVARQLTIDLTDPVANALEELRQAQEALAADKERGASQDVLNADRVKVKQAQANAEAAQFSQWFSDLQTADELGRISHQKYISYLEQRRDELLAISDRTRQEQDQLDQVEKALQAAQKEMQGQFNLGDIKVPTPFEVRRAIAARAAGLGFGTDGAAMPVGGAGVVNNTSTTNYITIDGADFDRVVRYLESTLGSSALSRRSSSTSRKV